MNHVGSAIPLGELLVKSDDWIELHPTTTYREVTVRLWGNGVVLRREATGDEIKAARRLRVCEGEFILSRIDARNGAFGLIPEELDGAVVSNDFPAFSVRADRLLPQFLRWMSKTRHFVGLCRAASEGTTNRVRLQEDRFLRMTIPLPPLSEQRRIVAKIEQLAAKIDEARSLREHSEEEVVALFVSEYRQLLTPDDDSWRNHTVEECCEALIDYRGRTPPISESGIPHITSANIRNGRIDWNTSKFVTPEAYDQYMTRGIPRPGDVIFTMEAPLGEAAVIGDTRKFSLAQRTLLMRRQRTLLTGEFLARAMMAPDVREAIYAQATGTTVKGIAAKRLKKIQLPVPPLREQRRIVAYLDDLQAKVDRLEALQAQTATELDALLPSILDKAFKGEL